MISKNIKILRERYNLSQKELAVIAGVSDKAVSSWERGTKEPRMGAIQKLAEHFNLKKSNLIEDDGMTDLISAPQDFTPKEKELIKKYRRLTPEGKETVDTILDLQYRIAVPEVKKRGRNIIFVDFRRMH